MLKQIYTNILIKFIDLKYKYNYNYKLTLNINVVYKYKLKSMTPVFYDIILMFISGFIYMSNAIITHSESTKWNKYLCK